MVSNSDDKVLDLFEKGLPKPVYTPGILNSESQVPELGMYESAAWPHDLFMSQGQRRVTLKANRPTQHESVEFA